LSGPHSAAAVIDVLSMIRLLCSYICLRSFHAASGSKSRPSVQGLGDLAMIEPVLAKSRDLTRMIGDWGDEYR
jgi:hypothetical protein